MTVKLWGVDRLHLRLIIILNPIHILFFSFCSKCCLFNFFIYETYPIQAFKKRMHEAIIKMFLFTSRYSVLSFDVLYVQIFI